MELNLNNLLIHARRQTKKKSQQKKIFKPAHSFPSYIFTIFTNIDSLPSCLTR